MPIRELKLKPEATVRAASVAAPGEIAAALDELTIPHPRSVIVLVGGADGIGWLDSFPVRKAIRIVARLAEETQSVVVDGGTQAGIMTEIGRERKSRALSFPLIGVVFEKLLEKEKPEEVLDPHHTHFFLVPGRKWGDEAVWIAKIATAVAGDRKSITILINGGSISKTDVEFSHGEDRPAFVMRGTGRMADEIEPGENVIAVDISEDESRITDFLSSRLRQQPAA